MFDTPGGRTISNREVKIVHLFLQKEESSRILDVGVGNGRIASTLVAGTIEIVGVDMTRASLRTPQENADAAFLKKRQFLIADGQHLPFRNSSFNTVICVRVLKYFADYKLGLDELVRALKQGGTLILEISNILSWKCLCAYPGS